MDCNNPSIYCSITVRYFHPEEHSSRQTRNLKTKIYTFSLQTIWKERTLFPDAGVGPSGARRVWKIDRTSGSAFRARPSLRYACPRTGRAAMDRGSTWDGCTVGSIGVNGGSGSIHVMDIFSCRSSIAFMMDRTNSRRCLQAANRRT